MDTPRQERMEEDCTMSGSTIMLAIIMFVMGFATGYIFNNKKVDMSVEQAIGLLKAKGYWVNININPKNKGE